MAKAVFTPPATLLFSALKYSKRNPTNAQVHLSGSFAQLESYTIVRLYHYSFFKLICHHCIKLFVSRFLPLVYTLIPGSYKYQNILDILGSGL